MTGAYPRPQKASFSGTRATQTGKASKPVLWSVSRDCTNESKVQRERAVAFQRGPGRSRPLQYPASLSPAPLPSLNPARRRTARIGTGPATLTGGRIYRCSSCKTHLCLHDDIISRVRCSNISSPSQVPEKADATSPYRTSEVSMAKRSFSTQSSMWSIPNPNNAT